MAVVVGRVADMPPGSRRVVDVRGRAVIVLNVDGEFFALLNRCPHQGADLCNGIVTLAVTSDRPGDYRAEEGMKVIRCPWHNWEFDVRTGQSWFDPRKVRVRRFETRVVPGEELVKGPYTAEAFEVRTEGDYVLLEA